MHTGRITFTGTATLHVTSHGSFTGTAHRVELSSPWDTLKRPRSPRPVLYSTSGTTHKIIWVNFWRVVKMYDLWL